MGLRELKGYVWRGLAGAYRISGASRLRHRGTVAILTYHRILSAQDLTTDVVQAGMYVRADVFRMHIEFLRSRFEVLSLQELLERWRRDDWNRNASACVITFDDGWLDNYRHAFPILKQYNIPATIFLPTDFIGTSRWFWPDQLQYYLQVVAQPTFGSGRRAEFYAALVEGISAGGRALSVPISGEVAPDEWGDEAIEACKGLDPEYLEKLLATLCAGFGFQLPNQRVVMNWDEVREMSAHGVSFGSHSCSHRLLDQISPDECRAEASRSYDALRKNGVNLVPVFCYPNGNYSEGAKEAVKAAGYDAAVSCNTGLERESPSDLYALRRISLHQDISATRDLMGLAISGLR